MKIMMMMMVSGGNRTTTSNERSSLDTREEGPRGPSTQSKANTSKVGHEGVKPLNHNSIIMIRSFPLSRFRFRSKGLDNTQKWAPLNHFNTLL